MRIGFHAALVCLAGLVLGFSSEVSAKNDGVVPEYVLEAFGAPPADIPSGELSEDLARAVDTVFVESLEFSAWGRDQDIALGEVKASDDPRLAWIIADMMRFTYRQSFDDALSATARCCG